MPAGDVLKSVSTFENLVSLDASGNNLYGSIGQKDVLAVLLRLDSRNLALTPTFRSLVTLRISNNRIDSLPESFKASSSSASTAKFFTALYANNNTLSGSLPSYYFEQLDIIDLLHNPVLKTDDSLPSSTMPNKDIQAPVPEGKNCQCSGLMASGSRSANVAWAIPATCKFFFQAFVAQIKFHWPADPRNRYKFFRVCL